MKRFYFWKTISVFSLIVCCLNFVSLLKAEEAANETEATNPIEDNSFFVEEAYNQEAGIVQFIQGFDYNNKAKSYNYSFTNEIPIGDNVHQFSYNFGLDHPGGGVNDTKLTDLFINYRCEAYRQKGIIVTPRISLIAPTGDYKKGFGKGSAGVQLNHIVTLELSKYFITHFNMGGTLYPKAKDGTMKEAIFGFNYGSSLIWLLHSNFNMMVEVFGTAEENFTAPGVDKWTDSYFISPGFRTAINLPKEVQVVPGMAVPIGIGESKGEWSLYFYLSIEPKLW